MSEINVLTGQPITQGELGSIATMAARVLALETEILDDEQRLDQKREALRLLKETTLPEAMLAVGLASFKLQNGRQLHIDKFYSCGMPAIDTPMRDEAFNWLRNHGHGGLIKTSVISNFARGEEENASMAMMLLGGASIPFVRKEDVHAMTLKSFVREQYESGQSVPADLFRVFIGNRVKIK